MTSTNSVVHDEQESTEEGSAIANPEASPSAKSARQKCLDRLRNGGLPDGHPHIVRWSRITGLRLPGLERAVLERLALFANLEGLSHPSQAMLSLLTTYSEVSIYKALHNLEALDIVKSELRRNEEGFHKQHWLQGWRTEWQAGFPELEEDLNKPVNVLLSEDKKRQGELLEQKDALLEQKDDRLARLEKLLADAGIDTSILDDPTEVKATSEEEKKEEEEEREISSSSSSSSGEDPPSPNSLRAWSDPFAGEVQEKVKQHWQSLRRSKDNPGGWRNPQDWVIGFYIKNPDRFRADIARIEEWKSETGGGNGRIGPGMHVVDQVAKFEAYEEEIRQRRENTPVEERDPEAQAEWLRQIEEMDREWKSGGDDVAS